MRKDVGAVAAIFPMPVLMIAAYDEDGKVCIMNAAWGMTCARDKVALFIGPGHATTKALLHSKAFTVSIADQAHMKQADFVGIASGNTMADKFERSGLTAVKSKFVNAPVIQEFPVCIECELAEQAKTECLSAIVGKVVNTSADEKVVDAEGKIDAEKIGALMFDTVSRC